MAYKKKTKKNAKRNVETVVAHVKASFNNTMVSVTTTGGDVLVEVRTSCVLTSCVLTSCVLTSLELTS